MLNRSCMCPCFKMLHVIHWYIYIYMYIYTVQDVSNCPAVIKVVTSKVQWGSSCDFVLMISIRSFLPFQKFFTLLKNKQSTSQTKSATENSKKHSTPVLMAQSVLLWFVFLLATIIMFRELAIVYFQMVTEKSWVKCPSKYQTWFLLLNLLPLWSNFEFSLIAAIHCLVHDLSGLMLYQEYILQLKKFNFVTYLPYDVFKLCQAVTCQ